MHGGSSASLVDERLTTKAKIGAWLKSVGALFARSSWRHRAAPHAATCRKRTCRRKIVPLKQAVWKMGENIEWHIFLFSLYAVNETAIVASEKRSNLLKQKNGATISGIICLSVYDWIMQINRSSGPARHCSMIIYWYVHRAISCRRAQYDDSMMAQLFQMSSANGCSTHTNHIHTHTLLLSCVPAEWPYHTNHSLACMSHKNLIIFHYITTITNPKSSGLGTSSSLLSTGW